MKDLVKYVFSLLIATMLIAAMPTDAESRIYEDTIRLHILANSDTQVDQDLKLTIRDKLLTKYGSMLSEGKSVTEAKERISGLVSEIEADAEAWIKELGYGYNVSALISEEWYETREYEGFALPAGYYTSLRIIIGEGEGQNWWCVMYPPLCLEMATESAPRDDGIIDYSKEEISLIRSGKYQVKFKILEDLSRAFAKNG